MQLSPSAHGDTFCRDNLPAPEVWPDLEFTLPELAYPSRLNAADELLNPTIAAGGADRRCLLSPAGIWTYGDVASRAAQIAGVLTEDLGLVPGNRVLLRGPNNPWLAACWLGVLKAGAPRNSAASAPSLRSGSPCAITD
jgi:2-aminobenzoate-CoA ligase